MKQGKLNTLVEYHQQYLKKDDSTSEKMRLELYGKRFTEMSFEEMNLSNSYFETCIFDHSLFNGANLSEANFEHCIFNHCTFLRTNFKLTRFLECSFTECHIIDSDLNDAVISDCMYCALDVESRDNKEGYCSCIPMTCPSEGSFIGWKKVIFEVPRMPIPNFLTISIPYVPERHEALIKMRIPENARRSSATGRKCRCEFAEVLSIEDLTRGIYLDSVTNERNPVYKPVQTVYTVGEMVYPDDFDENRWHECTNGIHFFITKQEAIDYGR